ncbi:U3 small nucleolar RNA-associated protein 17 [Zancudomyces culisetae]|uniref:U3 small nucleolar RNA-associated protein 17 n=1 Tax=Zancudomyces culisetae TaxID=1213189 RepID=A0A1R1PEU0_ZANCU|nr:U3 small nucleolar RNA-associated protein 17 [Zancudomyces culisetae]|eukprot:OMH79433.1 U3 small nucleolar RNA-associated protein 17 [Zancudomyces culisetae]
MEMAPDTKEQLKKKAINKKKRERARRKVGGAGGERFVIKATDNTKQKSEAVKETKEIQHVKEQKDRNRDRDMDMDMDMDMEVDIDIDAAIGSKVDEKREKEKEKEKEKGKGKNKKKSIEGEKLRIVRTIGGKITGKPQITRDEKYMYVRKGEDKVDVYSMETGDQVASIGERQIEIKEGEGGGDNEGEVSGKNKRIVGAVSREVKGGKKQLVVVYRDQKVRVYDTFRQRQEYEGEDRERDLGLVNGKVQNSTERAGLKLKTKLKYEPVFVHEEAEEYEGAGGGAVYYYIGKMRQGQGQEKRVYIISKFHIVKENSVVEREVARFEQKVLKMEVKGNVMVVITQDEKVQVIRMKKERDQQERDEIVEWWSGKGKGKGNKKINQVALASSGGATMVAVSDTQGKIYVMVITAQEAIPQQPTVVKSMHWHAQGVGAMKLSSDGRYLYSGGEEGVVVIWQIAGSLVNSVSNSNNSNVNKDFLARLNSKIERIELSSSNRFLVASLSNNKIVIYDLMEANRVVGAISSINGSGIGSGYNKPQLIIENNNNSSENQSNKNKNKNKDNDNAKDDDKDRRDQSMVLVNTNRDNATIQLYDVGKDKEIAELVISGYTTISGEEGGRAGGNKPKLELVRISENKQIMVTFENRQGKEFNKTSMKIWKLNVFSAGNKREQQIEMTSKFDNPHLGNLMTGLEILDNRVVVSVGKDGYIRMFTSIDNGKSWVYSKSIRVFDPTITTPSNNNNNTDLVSINLACSPDNSTLLVYYTIQSNSNGKPIYLNKVSLYSVSVDSTQLGVDCELLMDSFYYSVGNNGVIKNIRFVSLTHVLVCLEGSFGNEKQRLELVNILDMEKLNPTRLVLPQTAFNSNSNSNSGSGDILDLEITSKNILVLLGNSCGSSKSIENNLIAVYSRNAPFSLITTFNYGGINKNTSKVKSSLKYLYCPFDNSQRQLDDQLLVVVYG